MSPDSDNRISMPKKNVSADSRVLLENALSKIRALKNQVQTLQSSQTQPIALVGIGCRFPGNANNADEFWQLILSGTCAVGEVPPERWDGDTFFSDDPETRGTMYTNAGGFIHDVDRFDPAFFGLTPREAEAMDPQQRLLLEVAYESLENAGIPARELNGSKTAVIMGIGSDDYSHFSNNSADPVIIDAYTSLGTARSIGVGRLAYVLGLQGPALQLDTSCSSSLLSIHLACQMLRNGEADMALAGGVNLMLTPEMSIGFSQLRALSPSGRCSTFDADADGYVRGEGCGIVVLKRLDQAIKDGDNIIALVRGSAANHDGKSNGMTAPNGAAQEAVIRSALQAAGVEPGTVGYLETHGTGTKLGDPIEVLSLGRVYGERPAQQPLYLGSVKANIGHLEAGAGVAAFIKAALVLKHKTLPPQVNFSRPNPHIPWDSLPVEVVREAQPWPGAETGAAGVSSFGMSGTNVHMVLEAYTADEIPTEIDTDAGNPHHLVMLSAESPASLRQLAADYQTFVECNGNLDADTISAAKGQAFERHAFSYACNMSRSLLRYRAALVADSQASLIRQLHGLQKNDQPLQAPVPAQVKTAFLFTGQGSQYTGMAQGLYRDCPEFRRHLDSAAECVSRELGQSLLALMWPQCGDDDSEARLAKTQFTQPALFAVEYALARLWISWGVTPRLMMGHSVGEIAAACIAGVFSLADAARLVCARARLMQALPVGGKMLAVQTTAENIQRYLEQVQGIIAIAAINSPEQVVVSGEGAAIDTLADILIAADCNAMPLAVSHAFHSPLMQPMLAEFRAVAESIDYQLPQIEVISNVNSQWESGRLASAEYWVEHVAAPVLFADGIQKAAASGCNHFVEVGPRATLLGMARATLGDNVSLVPSLKLGEDDWKTIQAAIGNFVCSGGSFSFQRFYGERQFKRIGLPLYPFNRQSYFINGPTVDRYHGIHTTQMPSGTGHPLIGERLSLPLSDEVRTQNYLTPTSPKYMQDHRLFGRTLVAAASHLSAFLTLSRDVSNTAVTRLRDLLLMKPLVLEDEPLGVQVILQPKSEGDYMATLASMPAGGIGESSTDAQKHATAKLSHLAELPAASKFDMAAAQKLTSTAAAISGDDFYKGLRLGFDFGPLFKLMKQAWISGSHRAVVEIHALETIMALDAKADTYGIYPGQLDVCFQLLGSLMNAGIDNERETYVPFAMGEFTFRHGLERSASLWCEVRLREDQAASAPSLLGDLWIWQENAGLLAAIRGFEFRKVTNAAMRKALGGSTEQEDAYQVSWRDLPESMPAAGEKTASTMGTVVVFAGRDDISAQFLQRLGDAGISTVAVYRGDAFDQAENVFAVDPTQKEHFARLAHYLESGGMEKPFRSAYLWGSGDPSQAIPSQAIPSTTIAAELTAVCAGLLYWVQAVPQLERLLIGGAATAMGLLTNNALWGFARSLMLERPQTHCCTLNASVETRAEDIVDSLSLWLQSDRPESHIRLDGKRHAVARLQPISLPRASVAIHPDKAYVITGALGGIGRALIEWLLARGATHLVLLSHREANNDESLWLQQLQAQVYLEVVDVATADAVELMHSIDKVPVPVAGIFHLAGRLHDCPVETLNWQAFNAVLHPKSVGGWNLLAFAQKLQALRALDFMLFFSSASAVLGSAGQVNYATANGFLNGLVDLARAEGLPAQSIAWGLWDGVGMGDNPTLIKRLQHLGLGAIDKETALAYMDRFLTLAPVQPKTCPEEETGADNSSVEDGNITVIPARWSDYISAHRNQFDILTDTGVPPFLSELPTATAEISSAVDSRVDSGEFSQSDNLKLIESIRALPDTARIKAVGELVLNQIERVMSVDRAQFDNERPLQELGMDSLMAVEIRNGLAKQVNSTLPTALLFKYPTAADLTGYLVTAFFQSEAESTDKSGGSAVAGDESLDIDAVLNMSESEVDELLDTING